MTKKEEFENKLRNSEFRELTYKMLDQLERFNFDIDNLPRKVGSKFFGIDVYYFVEVMRNTKVVEKKKVEKKRLKKGDE